MLRWPFLTASSELGGTQVDAEAAFAAQTLDDYTDVCMCAVATAYPHPSVVHYVLRDAGSPDAVILACIRALPGITLTRQYAHCCRCCPLPSLSVLACSAAQVNITALRPG